MILMIGLKRTAEGMYLSSYDGRVGNNGFFTRGEWITNAKETILQMYANVSVNKGETGIMSSEEMYIVDVLPSNLFRAVQGLMYCRKKGEESVCISEFGDHFDLKILAYSSNPREFKSIMNNYMMGRKKMAEIISRSLLDVRI